MKKSRLKKLAEREYLKLSKKEKKKVNKLKRIPVAGPGAVFDKKRTPRKKKWSETDE